MGVPGTSHSAVNGGAVADIIAAFGVLTEVSSQLENEPLKGAVGSATRKLVEYLEGGCRQLVEFFLGGLGSEGDSDAVAYDKLWTLRLMGKRSEVTRRWIRDAGGMCAIVRVMASHASHEKLLKEGTWLVYVLFGAEGLTELLRQNRGCLAVQEAAAWAIFELARYQRDNGQAGCAEWPQAETLMLLLLEALRSQNAPLCLAWGCCTALRALIEGQPSRARLFVERGGDEAVLAALGNGRSAGPEGESMLVAGMQLITTLVEGNSFAAQRLRSLGALDSLVACGLSIPGKVTDETMWTLGQVGGILAVLQVMSRAAQSQEAVRSGLAAMAKLTWLPLEEGLQQQFPQAVEALLEIARRVEMERSIEETVFTFQALGGVLQVLAPHIAPGSWKAFDDAVGLLIAAVGPTHHELVAQAACASLGHVGSRAPAWRQPLQAALSGLGQRMRTPGEQEESLKHQKCLFWTSAVIAGLPVMLNEMRGQPNVPNVQDAALCAIVDVLEDHTDGGDCGIDPNQVLELLEAILDAMRLHRTNLQIQWSGCHAIGLLHGHLSVHEALDSVLAALRYHIDEYKVVSGACTALRALLEPRTGRESATASQSTLARVVATLRSRDVAAWLVRILDRFKHNADKKLLEDVIYALGLIDGMQVALQVLVASDGKEVYLRSAGLQAIFELGRTFPDLLAPPYKAEIRAVVEAIALAATAQCEAGDIGCAQEETLELLRRAELLGGLLRLP